MFKGFSSSVKPKKEETESWEDLFAAPNTEKYLKSVKSSAGSSDQREQSHTQAGSTHARTNKTSCDLANVRMPSSLTAPPNTATHDGDDFTFKGGSHSGSVPNRDGLPDRRVDDLTDELKQLKISARQPDVQASRNNQINDGFGGWSKKMTVEELQNGIVPQGGVLTGFRTSGSDQQPKASVSTVSVDSGAALSTSTVSACGFNARSESSTTVPVPQPRTTSFAGFKTEKKTIESKESKMKVPFEDVEEAKAALARGKDLKLADSTADKKPLPPWGARPSFSTMLDGGRKKLVMASPPAQVSNFFMEQVYRSYGCTYDNASNTFFATSPGDRGRNNGQVVMLSGNCKGTPIALSRDLAEPAAIAVYQQGLSVCVVTNKGIFVFERKYNDQSETVGFYSRQISMRPMHRGIAVTAGGGIVSFSNGKIRLFDGKVDNGRESVLAEVSYDMIINRELFQDNPTRRMEKSNCCFMDIVNNRLVMSDLQKHVISLWEIHETAQGSTIRFVRAADVAVSVNQRGKVHAKQIPLGKCAYAAGIRLGADGWVLCADAEGRTIQIYDDLLNFVTRVEAPPFLPYISGLYVEAGGHMIVCDRKNEIGGLRVYMLEAVEKEKGPAKSNAGGGGMFAAAARQLQQSGAGARF